MAGSKRQRGLSFITVIFIVGVLAAVGLMLAQAFPSFLEYQAALKAINKARDGGTVQEVRAIFDRAAQIDDIRSISGKDLLVERQPDGTMSVSFQYEKRIPLYGPASLVIDYHGSNRAR